MTDPLWSNPRAAGAAQAAAAKRRAKLAPELPRNVRDTPAERAEWRGDEPPTARRVDAARLSPTSGAADRLASRGDEAPTAPLPAAPGAASSLPGADVGAAERPTSGAGDAPAAPGAARREATGGPGGGRPPRAPITKPGPFPVIASSLALFLAIVALLAFQMRAGADPAIGKGEPVQVAAATPAPRKVLIRRVIVTRIVEHRQPRGGIAPAAAAPPPSSNSNSAPAPSAPAPVPAAPAPAAPAPPPMSTQSS